MDENAMASEEPRSRLEVLEDEIDNFEQIANVLKPQLNQLPALEGIEIAGFSLPLHGASGGDHVAYIDFNKRCDLPARIKEARSSDRMDIVRNLEACRSKAGVLVVDVSGHRQTDAFLAGMLHQAFLMGAFYELKYEGSVTPRLFENLSVRFQDWISDGKFITVLYGEIESSGRFQFLSAGHERPLIFSRCHNRFMEIGGANLWQYPPFGITPFEHIDRAREPHPLLGFHSAYEANVLQLMGVGDILLIFTDGLTDHFANGAFYVGARLEGRFREYNHHSALQDLANRIELDIRESGVVEDDVSIVLIRKTS